MIHSIDITFLGQVQGSHGKGGESASIKEEVIEKVCITEEVHAAYKVSFVGALCSLRKSTAVVFSLITNRVINTAWCAGE